MKFNSLRTRLGLVLLSFVGLVFISVGVTFWGVDAQKKDALVINLAGRQRMLLQQMSRLTLEIARHSEIEHRLDLRESMNVFEQTLFALRDGGPAPYLSGFSVELPKMSNPAVLAELDSLAQHWVPLKAALNELLASETGGQEFEAASASVEALSPPTVMQADVVVRQFEADSTAKVNRLKWVQIAFLISAVCLLGLGGLITNRSVLEPVQKLTRVARRIAGGDLKTPVHLPGSEEIVVLSEAFENMRSQLKQSQGELHAWGENLEEIVAQRTKELEALYAVSREISSRLEIDHVLNSVTDRARQLLDGEVAYLCLLDEPGQNLKLHAASGPQEAIISSYSSAAAPLAGQVLAGEQALMCGIAGCQGTCQIMSSPYQTSHVAAPLRVGDQVIGALCVGSLQPDTFDKEDLALLTKLANAAAVALENARLFQQAERTGILEERSRLAAEMHDGLAQTLSYLLISVDLVAEQIGSGLADQALDTLERCRRAIDQASEETRRAIASLQQDFPLYYTLQEQLAALVQEYRGHNGRIEWEAALNPPVVMEHEEMEQILRIVREALLNAIKHSQAQHIRVRLEGGDEKATVIVLDDGCGFDPQNQPEDDDRSRHFGMNIMQARAARLGGSVQVQSAPGDGTQVILSWNLKQEMNEDMQIEHGSNTSFAG